MNQYTRENPPKRGNGRKIWRALVKAGMTPLELHYNPNNFGRDYEGGYGSWACTLTASPSDFGYLCGILSDDRVYLESLSAPFKRIVADAA